MEREGCIEMDVEAPHEVLGTERLTCLQATSETQGQLVGAKRLSKRGRNRDETRYVLCPACFVSRLLTAPGSPRMAYKST